MAAQDEEVFELSLDQDIEPYEQSQDEEEIVPGTPDADQPMFTPPGSPIAINEDLQRLVARVQEGLENEPPLLAPAPDSPSPPNSPDSLATIPYSDSEPEVDPENDELDPMPGDEEYDHELGELNVQEERQDEQYPDRPMRLIPPALEFDVDAYNGWQLLDDTNPTQRDIPDIRHESVPDEDQPPLFTGCQHTTIPANTRSPMDFLMP